MRQACNAEGFCIGIPIAGLRSLDLPADELIAFLGLDGGNLELIIREFGDILKRHRGGGLIVREETLIGIHVEVHVGITLFGGCLRREDGRKNDVAGFNTLAIGSAESHCVFQGIKGKLISGSQGNAPHVGRPTGKVLGGVGGDGVRGVVGVGGSIRPQRKGLGILRFRAVCPGAVLPQRAEVDDNLLQRLFDVHSLASGHRIQQVSSVDSRAVFDLAICNIVCSHNITVFDFNYLLRIKFRNLIAAILCSTRLTVDSNGLGGITPLRVKKIQVRQGHVAGVGDLHRIGDGIVELCLLLIRCLHNGDIGVGHLHTGCRNRGMGSAVTGGSSGGVGQGLAHIIALDRVGGGESLAAVHFDTEVRLIHR